MKKIYKTPFTHAIEIDMEDLIAESFVTTTNEEVIVGDAGSDEYGDIESLAREDNSGNLWDNEW